MSLSVDIEVEGDEELQDKFERVMEALSPGVAGKLIADRVALYISQHFAEMDATHPNKMGGTRTHFYEKASEDVHTFTEGDAICIGITEPIGLRQRMLGGDIHPVKAKALAIPAIPEAYGKGPREFTGLELIWPKGWAFGMLVEAGESATNKATGKKIGSKGTPSQSKGIKDRIFFWLTGGVSQEGDPSLIPNPDLIRKEIEDTVETLEQRL